MDKYDNALLCDNIDSDPQLKPQADYVQGATTQFSSYNGLFSTLPSVFVGLLLGSWLDKFSSKLPLLLPSFGALVGLLILTCIAAFNLPIWMYYLQSLVGGVFGGMLTIFSANYAFIAMTTPATERSWRFGILEACNTAGALLGSSLNGVLAPGNSYTFAFVVIGYFYVFQILYIILYIPELHSKKDVQFRKGSSSWFRFLFSCQNFVDALKVLFRMREWYENKHIACVVVSFWAYVLCIGGYMSLLFPFLSASPINITHYQYGFFQMGIAIAGFVGNTLILYLLKKFLKISDGMISIVGCTSWSAFFAILSIHTPLTAWVSLVCKLFQSYPSFGLRSILSQQVSADEKGQMFGFLAMSEGIAIVVGGILWARIYALTFELFFGFTFLLLSGIFSIAVILSFVVWLDTRRLGANDSDTLVIY